MENHRPGCQRRSGYCHPEPQLSSQLFPSNFDVVVRREFYFRSVCEDVEFSFPEAVNPVLDDGLDHFQDISCESH